MFETGKTYKVKVELEPGRVGFGRATIVDRSGNKLYVQFRTSKESHHVLARGSRLWFVGDASAGPMNGLWHTTVTGTKIVGGRTAMECSNPKFEPIVQRRRVPRVPFDCPVRVEKVEGQELGYGVRARNISRFGVGLEALKQDAEEFQVGQTLKIVLETEAGDIPLTGRVIRTHYDWLANSTAIGLEFTEVNPEVEASLGGLLGLLGAKLEKSPAGTELSGRIGGPAGQGLGSWIKSGKDSRKFLKGHEDGQGEAADNERTEKNGSGETT